MVRFINCSKCDEYKPYFVHGLCSKCYNKIRKYSKFGNRKYRVKTGRGYWLIYKPHHPYSRKDGYIEEHRYIIHLYLSIKYNRIIYLSTKYDVHHVNGIKDDNRIENLQLMSHSNHVILEQTKDTSDWFCNMCKSDKTYIDKSGCPRWYSDIEGHLCETCCSTIKYFRKKFTI